MAQTLFRSDDTAKWVYRYGNGGDGVYSSAGNATHSCAVASFSGASGAYTVTLGAASTFANGDIVFLHQTRGTGAGTCMFNYVVSGGGTTTLTLAMPLVGTFTDSGASQAQIVECKQYSSFTQNAGHTLTASAWSGDTGGIIPVFASQYATVAGTITATGGTGLIKETSGTASGGVGGGFRGGEASWGRDSSNGSQGYWGEGTGGDRTTKSRLANGNGGGGGTHTASFPEDAGCGAGGGYGAAGSNGANGAAGLGGVGGSSVGVSGLTTLFFGGAGGAGGGGYNYSSDSGGGGGAGGGIIIVISPVITVTGYIKSNGGNGGTSRGNGAPGGGGAGGSILLKCKTATLGTGIITANAGAGGIKEGGARVGGNGAVGRVHIDYGATYSGTTTPTIDARKDIKLLTDFTSGGII